ncbi:MAG TPA: hypothetical protein VM934_06445 [Pyrinomonadaceae bacterium]|nr:hypothetical protein [Pyrinomonadaceae bacterium]
MQSLSLHSSAGRNDPADLASEISRLEATLAERRAELAALQEEFRAFKARYTQIVGGPLAELAEVEAAIKEAEKRLVGIEAEEEEEAAAAADFYASPAATTKGGLRKLFWSVARMFHPDHAADEREARRRHTIMAEASRAYREGDVESLHTLLGDEGLQSFCASTAQGDESDDDLAARLLNLKEELRTTEFGLKRIKQDGMYRTMLSTNEEARQGRDALAAMAERIGRQIVKARHRLENLT